MVKEVMPVVPVTWNSGPEGRRAAAEATSAVVPARPPGAPERGLFHPGTQVPVFEEQSHCAPVLTLTQGVTSVAEPVQAPLIGGSACWNPPEPAKPPN